MSWAKIFAVIRREYLERVRTKAFWIATFLVPVFFLGYMAVQFAAIRKTSGERKIAVVDTTGRLAPALAAELASREQAMKEKKPGSRGIHWVVEPRPITGDIEQTKEVLRKEVLDKKSTAISYWIPLFSTRIAPSTTRFRSRSSSRSRNSSRRSTRFCCGERSRIAVCLPPSARSSNAGSI
jgi:hypothetical protein